MYHLREWYEDVKFNFLLPDVDYPLVITDNPEVAAKVHEMQQQHELAKEARKILHQSRR
jgi:hypothetical protein